MGADFLLASNEFCSFYVFYWVKIGPGVTWLQIFIDWEMMEFEKYISYRIDGPMSHCTGGVSLSTSDSHTFC